MKENSENNRFRTNSKKRQQKIIASLLTGAFFLQQSIMLNAFASEISGVTGSNGVFNINPEKTVDGIGFRGYEKFNLDANDVANLNFSDISTFVNLVDNKININGVVNSIRDGNFYNGKAIFVSPNGMVVGASGVLNVGSLGVYTPSETSYNNFKKNPTETGLNSIMLGVNSGEVTINGKVLSVGDINLRGGQVTVGKDSLIINGVSENNMQVLNRTTADALFNSLVNNTNQETAKQFAGTQDGQIIITSSLGTDIQGTVMNIAQGSESLTKINNMNNATNGIKVSGTISNAKGTIQLNNNEGDMTITGTIENNGTTGITRIFNTIGQDEDNNSKLTVGGNVNTKGYLEISNTGTKGMEISGTVNHTGDAVVTNGYKDNTANNTAAMTISGSVKTVGNATFTNYESGIDGMNVTGDIKIGGMAKYTNNGAGGLNIKQGGSIASSELEMLNTGIGGLNIDGTATNIGTATVTNEAGGLNIKGTFDNNGNATILNKDTATKLTVTGTVKGKNGTTTITNNASGGFEETSTGNINTAGLNITNTGNGGLTIANVNNSNNAVILNEAGTLTANGEFINNGNATFTNNGTNLTVNGNITNDNGTLAMLNQNGAFNINQSAIVSNRGLTNLTNNGNDGFNISGQVNNLNDKLTILNTGSNGLNITETGSIYSKKNLQLENRGTQGLNILGKSESEGTADVINKAGDLYVEGTFTHTGDATFTNDGSNLIVDGTITNKEATLKMINNNGAFNVNGTVSNEGTTSDLTNAGANGLNIKGKVFSNGDLTMTNTGDKGINIESSGRVNGNNNISTNNTANGGSNIKGLINAKKNVNITNKNSNVVIGDNTENDNYITASQNININNTDGSILNAGAEKILVKADGDLNMTAINGTIGSGVQQTGASTNSTGIGPKAQGSRDFTKSINGNIKGKVTAKTTDSANTNNDLVINYAAIDSDMNINSIKADGRVILTVDDSAHAKGETATGTQYNMINASSGNGTNIEGRGISLISNGSIGTKDNKITFIQTDADNYKMDGLANQNIYLKENSFNDANYGRGKEVTKNTVSTMIARKGDLDVEFAGNTEIENITAEGNLKVITRGKKLHIKNLGHIDDSAVTPQDYFGPRNYGTEDNASLPSGGYTKDDYKNEALPNNAVVKALDINHNIRPTEELVDGNHEAWADSEVRIDNAVLDKGTLEITADNIYANGIVAHFNKDGFTKEKDNSTNKVQGTLDGVEGIPTGKAVRPDDVTDTGRTETERNYYYPDGDGDGTFDGEKSNVDPDDGKVDATPLEIPDVEPDPTPDPTPDPDPDPDPDPTPDPTPDPDPDPDPTPDPTPDPDPDPDPTPDPTPDPDPDPDPTPDPTPDPDPEPDPTPDPTPDPDPDPDPTPDPTPDPDPIPDPIPDPTPNPPPPPTPPTPEPTPTPEPEQPVIHDEDGSIGYKQRIDEDNIETIDKRQYIRFDIKGNNIPVMLEKTDKINGLLDISRGGIAVSHENSLQVGDIIPVHLKYGDLDINANVKVVTATTNRAGAVFVNLDKATANKLLYLSIILEDEMISFNK